MIIIEKILLVFVVDASLFFNSTCYMGRKALSSQNLAIWNFLYNRFKN